MGETADDLREAAERLGGGDEENDFITTGPKKKKKKKNLVRLGKGGFTVLMAAAGKNLQKASRVSEQSRKVENLSRIRPERV